MQAQGVPASRDTGQSDAAPHAMAVACLVVVSLLAIRLAPAATPAQRASRRPSHRTWTAAVVRACLPRGPTRVDAGVVLRV